MKATHRLIKEIVARAWQEIESIPADQGQTQIDPDTGRKAKEDDARGYFAILAAVPGFFLSSLFLMLLWGIIAPKLAWDTISYPLAMLVTVTVWVTIAPLVATARSRKR